MTPSHRAEITNRQRAIYLGVGIVGVLVIVAAMLTAMARMSSAATTTPQQAAAALGLTCTKTDKANGGFLLDCDVPGGTPSPSASASPSLTPTASPSVSPSPSTSTVTPTASTSPSSTPSPTQTGPATGNCMPQPSRCGFPDATNTGVRPGSSLAARSGTVRLTAGQVLENAQVTGCVQVTGANVTIRNVRIISTCSYAAIDLEFPNASATITDVEIDMSRLANTAAFTGRLNQRSITGDDFTATRVWWHGGSDCVHFGSNVTIRDSFCDVAPIPAGYPGDPHIDGFQSAGGSNVMIVHNTIRNPNPQTSAIINGTTPSVSPPQLNVHIVGNLMAGGGYTVYCNAHQAATPATVEFRNNRISFDYYTWPIGPEHPLTRGGYWGPTTDCLNIAGYATNVWDGGGARDGKPLPKVENPGVGQL